MKWTLRSLFKDFWEAITGEGEPKEMTATEAVKLMQKSLSARADNAAFKQQGVADLETDVKAELARNQQLEAEAAQLYTQGHLADAQLRMAQKIASDEALGRLMQRLTDARAAAEVATSQFLLEQQAVTERGRELPALQADQAYLKRQKEIEATLASVGGTGGAVNAFDAHARNVRREIGASEKRDRLLSGGGDPVRELNIQSQINGTRLEAEMKALGERVAKGEVAGVLPAASGESAADKARRMLNPAAVPTSGKNSTTIPAERQLGG